MISNGDVLFEYIFAVVAESCVSEDISLRVKSGVLSIGATGDYLNDIQTRDSYAEILVKTTYETFTETLHGSANPIKDWDFLSPNYLGTHFVRSITYGGIMLASLRLYVKNRIEKESLEDYLRSHYSFNEMKLNFHATNDGFRLVRQINSFENKLQKLLFDVQTKVVSDTIVRIKYYATVTASRVPKDIPSFILVLQEFPIMAEKTNGGKGVPITVELIPLHELSSRMAAFRPDSSLLVSLQQLDSLFSDLLLTHKSIRSLSSQAISDYGDKCKVRDLDLEVHDKLDVFSNVINNLNSASPAALGLSKRAVQAYEQRSSAMSYYDRYKLLEEEVNRKSRAKYLKNVPRNANWFSNITNSKTEADKFTQMKRRPNDFYNPYSPTLKQLNYVSEMSMANAVCASLNQFGGSFITMRRNCDTKNVLLKQPCTSICQQLEVGPDFQKQGECLGVVASKRLTRASLGITPSNNNANVDDVDTVGAQTAILGRSTCNRERCFDEFCCCRLTRFSSGLL